MSFRSKIYYLDGFSSNEEEEYPSFRYRVLSGGNFERPIFSLQLLLAVAQGRTLA